MDRHETYHGSYNWPLPAYSRFNELVGLEETADDASQMKIALSKLEKVQQLALSLDNGLGWLNGPDVSLRSQATCRDPSVFGSSCGGSEGTKLDKDDLWTWLVSAEGTRSLKESMIHRYNIKIPASMLPGISAYNDIAKWPIMDKCLIANAVPRQDEVKTADYTTGVLCVLPDDASKDIRRRFRDTSSTPKSWSSHFSHLESKLKLLNPAKLSKGQKEWLLEASWAQEAFLRSYILAVVDNPAVFGRITVLNIARLSSQFVPSLCRRDFWEALPNVGELSLSVIPDWRIIFKDDAGIAQEQKVDPSKSHDLAHTLLLNYVGTMSSIKKLRFGWAAGGEQAEGMFARNQHILAAPVVPLEQTMRARGADLTILSLPHVEHLTLSNCWLTPVALVSLVNRLETLSLKVLSLDSVSLTAHPRHIVGNGNVAQGQQLIGGQVFNVVPPVANPVLIHPPQAAHQFAAQYWLGPQNGMAVGVWANVMQQRMHQWMQHHGIQQHLLHMVGYAHLPPGMFHAMYQNLAALATGGQAVVANNLPGLGGPGWNVQAQQAQPGFAAFNAQQHAQNHGLWFEGHDEGSWPDVVNTISPGAILEEYRARREFEDPPRRRKTQLVDIVFKSCGYVQLQIAPFDQSRVLSMDTPRKPAFFTQKMATMSTNMMTTDDKHMGTIVQYIPDRQRVALSFAWGLQMGWEDEEAAEEAEFDGYLPGGTGRFSGIIRRSVTQDDIVA